MNDNLGKHYSQSDLFDARRIRDQAIKTAVDHADDVLPTWSEQAFGWVCEYLKTHKGPFVCDELRIWAEKRGCPAPISNYAWGSVMAKSCRECVITKYGIRNHIFPDKKTTHMKHVTEWIVRFPCAD